MPAIFAPGYRGFLAFCEALGEPVEAHQRKIARATIAGPDREVVAILPRGNAKSTTAALVAVHHVASRDDPSVYVGAGSRDQARIIGRIVERLARKPALAGAGIQTRHDELRTGLRETILSVVASDGGRAHGWERPTLLVGDELWTWSETPPTLLGAMLTSLVKNSEARFLGISTAAAILDTQLGRYRTRALAQPNVTRRRAFTDARGDGLRWLEWSLGEDDVEDIAAVARCNPASWITRTVLREQRKRVTPLEYLQFHACRWGAQEGLWLPPGAWAACRGPVDATPREVVLGVDIGGTRAASALVGVCNDGAQLSVPICRVYEGDDAVLKITDAILALVEAGWTIRELTADPWRYAGELLRLEREHGLRCTHFPQSHARMTAASEGLHAVIVEQTLRHPGHPDLDRHVASAVAQATGRGWRLVKAARTLNIDAVVALAMSVERARDRPEPLQVIGWL